MNVEMSNELNGQERDRFNCQLKRNVPGLTGKWAMTKQHEIQGHDKELLDLMRTYELFAVDTKFKPKANAKIKLRQRKPQIPRT